ncbi:MAG TPA: DNA-formamidopyrimidine glycosylase family protein [Ferruginibacter sp.]|jgi:endonuclease-8|nr:DNA-formamidopyrimidine glycosylase family protein [Ferruginibacter sp.]
MPEGPSIVILKEAVQAFKGKKVLEAAGNAKIDMALFTGQKVIDFKTWGKHFLICFPVATIKIHLLMFGTYSINEQTKPDKLLRLHLKFKNGDLYFYTCLVRILEQDLNEIYDWSADVLNDEWNAASAAKKLKAIPHSLICDALLNQEIFAGVGNIIKNEVLYITQVHPKSIIDKIPDKKIKEIVKIAREYSFDFLRWKKAFELKKHWLAYSKQICPRCDIRFSREYVGTTKRRTFFCNNCQVLYQ